MSTFDPVVSLLYYCDRCFFHWTYELIIASSLSGHYRWQRASARSLSQHCGQAVAQRSEDCGSPVRSAQYLRRILPRKTYVALNRRVDVGEKHKTMRNQYCGCFPRYTEAVNET